VTQITLRALSLDSLRSLARPGENLRKAGQAMFPLYDHRERRVSRFDVTAIWIIAAVVFVTATVLWTL
jgi:hypothetical protein